MSDFVEIANEIGKLVDEKNKAYGDSFINATEILRILFPRGVPPRQYQDMLAIVRILDKLNRIASDKYAFEEDPWKDILGYALLSISQQRRKRKKDVMVTAPKKIIDKIEKDIKSVKDVENLMKGKNDELDS